MYTYYPSQGCCAPRSPCGGGAAFCFVVTDASVSCPVSGALFELWRCGQRVDTAVSDCDGTVCFTGLLPGPYQIKQAYAPGCYCPSNEVNMLFVEQDGCITVDGAPAEGLYVVNERIYKYC